MTGPPCGNETPDDCRNTATHRVAGGEPLARVNAAHRSVYSCTDHIDAARAWVAEPPARLIPVVHRLEPT